MDIYTIIRDKIKTIINEKKIEDKIVNIKARVLSSEEAIGNPEHNDYPLLKGKERLMQAEYKNAKGVAFTDMFGNFKSNLYKIINIELSNNFSRAVFIATINAILRYTGDIDKTEHCKDEGPVKCSLELNNYIKSKYGNPRILQIGHQPRFSEILSKNFKIKIIDMDKDNIGKKINGVTILSEEHTNEFINWADIVFVTGSTFVNNTATQFINLPNKEVIFYGVTGAGPTHLLNLNRYCRYGR